LRLDERAMSHGSAQSRELRLRGLGVSPGIAIGAAHYSAGSWVEPEPVTVELSQIESEVARFQRALTVTREQIAGLLALVQDAGGEAGIFEAHLLMVDDPMLVAKVEKSIREEAIQAEGAFWKVIQRFTAAMRQIDDEYLRERVSDIDDVAQRVLSAMGGCCAAGGRPTFPHVLLAHDLAPSETVEMDRSVVRGFATEAGSQTSHTTILARSLGIPAVVGLVDIESHIFSGDTVLIDGYAGLLILRPTEETLSAYEDIQSRRGRIDEQLHRLSSRPATTRDGHTVTISANIELAREIETVLAQGAQGVGLYRTEFLFLNRRSWPTEDEQVVEYMKVAQSVGSDGVIIRTLDLGGDKMPVRNDAEPEANPFLGWRGLRRSLGELDVFRAQLRAILRASAVGKVRLMFPLVSDVGQLVRARGIVYECMEALKAEGRPFDETLEIGAMIEVPSAAVVADLIAPEVDFFSIGTNDLIQYTLAVDRGNERVSDLYEPCHPAVIRLIEHVCAAAEPLGRWVGVCGEMASDLRLTPLLIGLGVTELSVGGAIIPRLKHAVRMLDASECRTLVARARSAHQAQDVFRLCREMARTYYAELLE
jgi:phosphoenolpyruvate-protein phosphotransferase (PTS system enzyme I)